jgi:hypothetical protein
MGRILRAGGPRAHEGIPWSDPLACRGRDLERMISRRVPLEDFEQAIEKRPDDVKVVLDL